MGTNTRKLLARVAARERLCCVAGRFFLFVLILGAVYAALLLCSRLLGIIPNWFVPINLLTLTAAALAAAVAFHPRHPLTHAARLIDAKAQTDDLFLTVVLIDRSAGRYKPLVLGRAEGAAPAIRPRAVVPYLWATGARNLVLMLCALLAGIWFLPQLDPFGKEQRRQQVAERGRELEKARKATTLRLVALTEKGGDAELSEEVQRALGALTQSFRAMKPNAMQGNLKRLGQDQDRLGDLWRKAKRTNLPGVSRDAFGAQRFGAGGARKAAQWREQLRRGDAAGVKKQIEELERKVQRLAELPPGLERKKLAREIRNELEDLQQCVGEEMGAQPLNAALDRALDQLAMSEIEGMSGEVLQGLQESLELSELELEALAQSVRDLQSLEEALEALQLAKRLNELESLDGEGCQGCESMAEFLALYEQLMAGGRGDAAAGIGIGMRGPGTGKGGRAEEDPDAETEFRTEKSRSSLTAGKILLSLKTRGVSGPGDASVEYRYVEEVKKGVSEAMLHEQVPAAYHETIRKYFDTLEKPHEEGPAE